MWVWPLVVLLSTYNRFYPGLRLLYKSTWVLFAGMCQTWILVLTDRKQRVRPKWFVPVLVGLTFASFFLLPFGLGMWEWDTLSQSYSLVSSWNYGDNLYLSFMMHLLYLGFVGLLADYTNIGYGWSSCYLSSGVNSYTGSDYWEERPRQDQAGRGWPQISDSFYGHRGEFDINDEARRASEDIQQFHNAHPDADLSDHYFWDEILDAETDDYV